MTLGTDREEIVRRFEALLDAALSTENPPAGIDADILESVLNDSPDPVRDPDGARRCDEYALWAAMTALTQEIKLQGRAFQELNRALTAQTEKIAEEPRAVYASASERCDAKRSGAAAEMYWARSSICGTGWRVDASLFGFVKRRSPPRTGPDGCPECWAGPFRANRPAPPRQWARWSELMSSVSSAWIKLSMSSTPGRSGAREQASIRAA